MASWKDDQVIEDTAAPVAAPPPKPQKSAVEQIPGATDAQGRSYYQMPANARPGSVAPPPTSIGEQMFGLGSPVVSFLKGAIVNPLVGSNQLLANTGLFGEKVKQEANNLSRNYNLAGQESRARTGREGFDFAELTGSVLSPFNKLFGPVKGPNLVETVGRSSAAAMGQAAVAPTTNTDNYFQDKANDMVVAGLIGGVIPVGIQGIKGIKTLATKLSEGVSEESKVKLIKAWFNSRLPEDKAKVMDALRNPQEIVAGSRPTVAEALADMPDSTTIAAAQKTLAGQADGRLSQQFALREAAQQEARKNLLGTVAGTADDLAAAEKLRTDTAEQLYGATRNADLPGRERVFKTVKVGESVGGASRIDPITGQPVMVPSQVADVAKDVAGQSSQRTLKVEVGRDSFNRPIFEERTITLSTPAATQAGTRNTLTNTPNMKQDVSLGGQPLYKFVLNGHKYDDRLKELMDRPSIQKAFDQAAVIAKDKGLSMFKEDGKLTGQGAHLVKLALDDAINPTPGTPLAKNTAKAIEDAKKSYLSWVEEQIPAYKTARETFAKQSVPIDQMKIGQYLAQKLNSPLDVERAGMFAKAVQEAPQTIKKATGNPRYDTIEQALTPKQSAAVRAVEADLLRSSKAAENAARTRSASGKPDDAAELPNLLNRWATVTNVVLKALKKDVNAELNERIGKLLLEPENLAGFLSSMPKEPGKAKVIAGAIMERLTPENRAAFAAAVAKQEEE